MSELEKHERCTRCGGPLAVVFNDTLDWLYYVAGFCSRECAQATTVEHALGELTVPLYASGREVGRMRAMTQFDEDKIRRKQRFVFQLDVPADFITLDCVVEEKK